MARIKKNGVISGSRGGMPMVADVTDYVWDPAVEALLDIKKSVGKKRRKSGPSRAKKAYKRFNRLTEKNSKNLSSYQKKAIANLQLRVKHRTLGSYCKDPRKIKSKYSKSHSCILKDTRDERKNMAKYGASAKVAQKVYKYNPGSRRFEGNKKLYKFPRSAVARSQNKPFVKVNKQTGEKTEVIWKHGAKQTAGGNTAADFSVNKRGKLVVTDNSENAQERYSANEDLQDTLASGRTKCVKTLIRKIENGETLKKVGQYHLIAKVSEDLGVTMSPKVSRIVKQKMSGSKSKKPSRELKALKGTPILTKRRRRS